MAYSDLILLGAGASRGARCATDNHPPPLGDELAAYLSAWLVANEPATNALDDDFDARRPPHSLWQRDCLGRVHGFLKRAAEVGFEAAIDELVADHRVERSPEEAFARIRSPQLATFDEVQRVIAYAMLVGEDCRFPEKADDYDRLLRELGVGAGVHAPTFITFNYDILLEEAVTRVLGETAIDRAIRYPGVRQEGAGRIEVIKPHGSINWIPLLVNHGLGTTEEIARRHIKRPARIYRDAGVAGRDSTEEFVPTALRENLVLEMKHQGEDVEHVAALYGRGKPAPRNAPAIHAARAHAIERVRMHSHGSITVIGLRPPKPEDPEDDPILADLFATLSRHQGAVTYVSPSDEDCRLAERYDLVGRRTGFAEWVNELAARVV